MLKHIPIGRIARRYSLVFISVLLSTRVVVRARICVATVANNICHVVRVIEKGNLSRIHLLNIITIELKTIHSLDTY